MRHGEEVKLERNLIDAFRKSSCIAYHADMLADGFPDLLVLKGKHYCLIELKVCETLEIDLVALAETSQPPMWYTLASKATPAYLVVQKSNGLFVYGTDYKDVNDYLEPNIAKLPFYGVYNSCEELVRWILPTLV